MSSETEAAPGDSLEPIKQVTMVEAELAAKLARLRESVKDELETLQRENESLLQRTRADAEKERESALTAARAEGEREAERILAEGATHAEAIQGKSPAELGRQREALLSAILAEFRPAGKRTAA